MGTATVAGPAATTSNKPVRTFFGDRVVHFFDVSPSSSYATGGDVVSFGPRKFGFELNFDWVEFEVLSVDATHVYRAEYVRSTGLLKLYNALTGAEIANASDNSALTFRCMVIGK